jgi:putative phosphoribosyl transferase
MAVRLPFEDRSEAGRTLAAELAKRRFPPDTVVLALPRGGVPVGVEVASKLGAPLDVIVVRKVGVPWQPELAMGAIAGSVELLDDQLIGELGISREDVEETVAKEKAEVERREKRFRAGRPPLELSGRTVLIVDDGLATGSTMLAAVRYAKKVHAAHVVAAVPVGSDEAVRKIGKEADECLCLATPEYFAAVGEWYIDFQQVSDADVERLLEASRHQPVKT